MFILLNGIESNIVASKHCAYRNPVKFASEMVFRHYDNRPIPYPYPALLCGILIIWQYLSVNNWICLNHI